MVEGTFFHVLSHHHQQGSEEKNEDDVRYHNWKLCGVKCTRVRICHSIVKIPYTVVG